MKTFEFSIVATGLDPQADDFESRFYDAGCDDALVSFQKGHIIIDFARESDDIISAITSAQADVEKAGATIVRIEPDPLVSLSEIASRAHCSRAAVSLYAKGLREQDFPSPIVKVTSDSPLWNWSEVSKWMFARGKINRVVAVEAFVFEEANTILGKPASERGPIIRSRLEECWHVEA